MVRGKTDRASRILGRRTGLTTTLKRCILAGVVLASCGAWGGCGPSGTGEPAGSDKGARKSAATEAVAPPVVAAKVEATEQHVRELCSKCHAYPPPDSFPREVWRKEVQQAYRFIKQAKTPGPYAAEEDVVQYYEARAPEAFPTWEQPPLTDDVPVKFVAKPVTCSLLPEDRVPSVASLQVVRMTEAGPLELLVCDADSGQVMLYSPARETDPWRLVARLPVPATGCVVDLDADGIRDLVIADLGRLVPGDERMGKVVWLRGRADGSYEPKTLATGLGRVAEVRAADFRGTGKLDLVVAVYGWRAVGEILLLENHVDDWDSPRFQPRVIDSRHGAIHVPVTDLNDDGRPDFVALIAQDHEMVVGFVNQGGGQFEPELIYRAPHPAYGCSGIELVDMNGDDKLDVLLSNGDTLDGPAPVRPYYGVRWLENRGEYPYVEHSLAAMPGAMRALAADVDGDGDQDVVAVSFLPAEYIPAEERSRLDSIILLEQRAPGEFRRHIIERGSPDHLCCVLGDWRGNGRVGLVAGNFSLPRSTPAPPARRPLLTIWE